MKRLSPVFIILFILLTSCTSGERQPPSKGGISGIVIDSSDGSPIPFANVITKPPTSSVTTDVDGIYLISGVYPGYYTVIASKQISTSREVRVAVAAGMITTGDLHFGSVQTQLSPTTLPPAPTVTDDDISVYFGSNMLANGCLDEDDFGVITNWANTNIELYRWYLVQDVSPSTENEDTRWVEWVEMIDEERGHVLRSIDYQNCNYFCSTSAVQIVPAQEYKTYTLSAEAKRERGEGGKIYIDFLNANRVRISAKSKGEYRNDWSRQELTLVAPEGTRFLRGILYTDNGHQGIVYWDNVELREIE